MKKVFRLRNSSLTLILFKMLVRRDKGAIISVYAVVSWGACSNLCFSVLILRDVDEVCVCQLCRHSAVIVCCLTMVGSRLVSALLVASAFASPDCNTMGHCFTCASTKSLPFTHCRWCPEDQQCHATGSLENVCPSALNIVDPDKCPHEPPARTGFDPVVAGYMIDYAWCAYDSPPPAVGSKCYPSAKTHADEWVQVNFTASALLDPSISTTVFMYAGVHNMEESIVLAFKGTDGSLQLLDELINTDGVAWPGHGMINHYFAAGAIALLKDIEPHMTALMADHPRAKVWITGHSLGGALASLVAYDLLQKKIIADAAQVQVYTMGQPRVGNLAFANAYNELVPRTYRMVNAKDIVPHLPPCGTNLPAPTPAPPPPPPSPNPPPPPPPTPPPPSCPSAFSEGACCSGTNVTDPAGRCNGYADFWYVCAVHAAHRWCALSPCITLCTLPPYPPKRVPRRY